MLKLVQTDNGVFDLAFDDPAMQDEDAAVQTLVYATLFTHQVAPEGRVADPLDQRGWWNDVDRGTGLWYVRRQAASPDAKQEALNMIKRALESKTEALTDIVVTDITEARNVSSLILAIEGLHNGRKFSIEASL